MTAPPAITAQPLDQTVSTGANAAFNVVAAGAPPLHYQWQDQGVDIPGATDATLTLRNVSPSDAGAYSVAVSKEAGAINSAAAQLTVNSALAITSQPQDQAAPVQSTIRFTVEATGNPPLRFQWRMNGTNIDGAVGPSLLLANVRTNDAGLYDVVVSSGADSVTSSAARLTVTLEAPLRMVSGTFQPDGSFHLVLSGPIGGSFVLQSSPDLLNWTQAGTITFATETSAFDDPTTPRTRSRFYRLESTGP